MEGGSVDDKTEYSPGAADTGDEPTTESQAEHCWKTAMMSGLRNQPGKLMLIKSNAALSKYDSIEENASISWMDGVFHR